MPSCYSTCPVTRPRTTRARCSIVLSWLASILALLLVACVGDPGEEAPYRVVTRLLPEVPEVFSPDEIASFETVFEDDFSRPETVELWRRHGFDLADKTDPEAGEWILGASGVGTLERAVALDASTVDRLEVLMIGLEDMQLELSWAGPGEDFASDRSATVKARRHAEPPSFRFELGHRATWQGSIDRLRLRFEPGAHRRARLLRLWAVDRQVDPRQVERTFARPWKIRLRSDTRGARLVSAERPVTYSLDVPGGAFLEGAFGRHRKRGPATGFAVELVDAAGKTTQLFAAEVGDGALESVLWHSARIDLASWAGQEVSLRFLADAPETVLAAWGELKVLAPVESAAPPAPDVMLVVVDTLRADRLSLYGYEHETSPRLDAWAEEHAVVFRSAVAPAPWTFPSHVSLFTGFDTLSHGYNDAVMLPEQTEMLAELLQRAGYETLAVTAGGFVSPRFGFAQGFDRYYTNTRGNRVAEGDLPFNIERSLQWLGEGDRPRFLFFHTFEVHSPYHVRQPYYRQLFGDEGDPELIDGLAHLRQENGTTAGAVIRRTLGFDDGTGVAPLGEGAFPLVSRAYDSGVAYADHLLGDFFSALERRGRPTLFVITSDHGEALGEHGGLGEHGYLYDHNLMVPLLLALPDGRGAGTTIERQVRTVDVFPTVLDALGLEERPEIDGRSLLPLLVDERADFPRVAWSTTAMQGVALRQDGKVKYVANPTLWERERAPEALFRLDEDPEELEDLASSEPTETFYRATVERYFSRFKGLLLVVDPPVAASGTRPVETIEVLGPESLLTPPQIRSFDAPQGALPISRPGAIEILVQAGRTPAGRTPGGRTPAGEPFSVAFERIGPRAPLRLRLVGEETCELDLAEWVGEWVGDSEGLPPPIRLGADCRPLDQEEDSGDGFGLTLLFNGDESLGAEAPELSPELERQLEALGYLD